MDTKRLTKIGIGCTVAMLIPTIILGWWAIDWARGVAEWSEKADEFPTVSELRGPAIPDAENAALIYQQAWEALNLTDSEGRLLASSDDPTVLAPIIAKNREPLRLFHEAARMEHCRFEWKFVPVGMDAELSQMRKLTRLPRGEAVLALLHDDTDRALGCVEDISRHVAQRLHSPANTMDFAFTVMALNIAENSLVDLLSTMDLPADWSAALRQQLVRLDPKAAFMAALRTDVAAGLEMLDRRMEGDAPASEHGERPGLSDYVMLTLNRAKLMEVSEAALGRADLPRRELSRMEPVSIPDSSFYLWAQMLQPFANAAGGRDSQLATREMMLVALDISAFAAENGRLPNSLDELPQSDEPDYAIDPFSGERLRYEPGEGRAFKLWSVGRDLDDDGGVARGDEPDLSWDEIDLVFRVAPTP